MYQLTDANDNDVYVEGSAQDILDALIRGNVKFVDTDGSRLHVRLA